MNHDQGGPAPGKRNNQVNSRLSLIVFAIWMGAMLLLYRPAQTPQEPTVDLSQVAAEVRGGQVQKIFVEGDTLHVKRADGSEQLSIKESLVSAPDALAKLGVSAEAMSKVSFEVKGPSASAAWISLLTSLLPMALFLGFILYMSRKQQAGMGQANPLNEGALLAARRKSRQIGMGDIEVASERVILGPERRGRIVTAQEKAVAAYHEAGHALVARMVPHADPVHKITIVGRGRAGGYTQLLPAEERHLWSKSQFQDALVWILAGQAAEELVFGEATTGASNDLVRATGIARAMVTRYGMSELLGPLALGRREGLVFLGKDMAERQEYSEETARLIDQEVRRLVEEAKARAMEILTETRAILDRVAQALIERETLDAAQFEALVLGTSLDEKPDLPRLVPASQCPVPAMAASTDR